jgi:hypothetical protein
MHFGLTYEICQYLNYFDMLALTSLSPDEELIQSLFPPKLYVNQRLVQLGINSKEFNSALIKSESIIAGSFPLQCLLGECWDSDLDIYNKTLQPTYGAGYNYEWLEKYFQTDNNIIEVTKYSMYKTDEVTRYSNKRHSGDRDICKSDIRRLIPLGGYGKINTIQDVINFKINEFPCQFISHRPRIFMNRPEDRGYDVFDCFDFEFCKLKYDGKKLHVISDMNIIRNKTCTLTQKHVNDIFLKNVGQKRSRCKSYKKEDFDYLIEKRINKYRKRGFNIIVK